MQWIATACFGFSIVRHRLDSAYANMFIESFSIRWGAGCVVLVGFRFQTDLCGPYPSQSVISIPKNVNKMYKSKPTILDQWNHYYLFSLTHIQQLSSSVSIPPPPHWRRREHVGSKDGLGSNMHPFESGCHFLPHFNLNLLK
jgi:hypothetical protein